MVLTDDIISIINLIDTMLSTIQFIPGLSLGSGIMYLIGAFFVGKVVGFLFRE